MRLRAHLPRITRITRITRLAFALPVLVTLALPSLAHAQRPQPQQGQPARGRGRPAPPPPGTVDPKAQDDEDEDPQPGSKKAPNRAEPQAQGAADPLAVPEEIKDRIGTDSMEPAPAPVGRLSRSFFPVYEEERGDYRFRFLPPFYLEHKRLAPAATAPDPAGVVAPSGPDRESLFALLYYQRRSPRHDADIIFPFAWHVRDDDSRTFVLGPLAHREAANEHDNWLAPLAFTGARKDGGYFHFPLLLTSSHWGKDGAFTLIGPYFRDRTGTDVDRGVAPFFFQGDNGNTEGGHKTYTLIPPLAFYHREREADESTFTVAGPVITHEDPKRFVFDIAPFYFSIRGKPDTGGVKESHTTIVPLFHSGYSPSGTLFAFPGYLHRTTPLVDTTVTPFYVHATTRKGRTSLTTAGPIVPLYYSYDDKDTGFAARGFFPFYYGDQGNEGQSLWTPLFARFERYGESRTYWTFPNVTVQKSWKGWETDFHPIVYLGRSEHSSHLVVAPFLWDFATPKSRATVAFPFFWRFADTKTQEITQVTGNTVYIQKKASGTTGLDWQFHFVPLFSYGENPAGYFWNFLFGLAGYKRQGTLSQVKALWLPITLSGSDPRVAPNPQ